jgi:hypothetical protein
MSRNSSSEPHHASADRWRLTISETDKLAAGFNDLLEVEEVFLGESQLNVLAAQPESHQRIASAVAIHQASAA